MESDEFVCGVRGVRQVDGLFWGSESPDCVLSHLFPKIDGQSSFLGLFVLWVLFFLGGGVGFGGASLGFIGISCWAFWGFGGLFWFQKHDVS